jgi:hypothetical protein
MPAWRPMKAWALYSGISEEKVWPLLAVYELLHQSAFLGSVVRSPLSRAAPLPHALGFLYLMVNTGQGA